MSAQISEMRLTEAEKSIGVVEVESRVELRKKFAGWILFVFVVLNVGVLSLVFYLANRDARVMADAMRVIEKQSTNNLEMLRDVPLAVGGEVLATLIGATAVQVGTAVYVMGKFLFPALNDNQR